MTHSDDTPVIIGNEEVLEKLVSFCKERNQTRFYLVADQNTYLALGVKIEATLLSQGWFVKTIMLEQKIIHPDEKMIFQILDQANDETCVFLAVGGGTIHDLVRFVSNRTHRPFISLPTAASVDGFSSNTCSLLIDGYKSTFQAWGPQAIFVYLTTLCAAPTSMTAAGFGDMLGKFTSLADWKLGQIIWDEPYDEEAARETRLALESCMEHIEEISLLEHTGIENLIKALIQSGFSMQKAGSSRPAGGSEHHLAHYWEIKRLRNHQDTALHGERVAVGTYLSAGYYAAIRRMSLTDAKKYFNKTKAIFFSPQDETIEAVFGGLAERVKTDQQDFFMDEEVFASLKKRVLDNWTDIQAVCATVPSPPQIEAWLTKAGTPAQASAIGITPEEVKQALMNAHLLRGRFTMLKLAHLFGMA